MTMIFFWCKFGFGKCFRAASQSIPWAGHLWLLYKIHFSSYITIPSRNGSRLCRIREDNTSKWFFKFSVSSRGTHLLSFFTIPICFKCPTTVECLTLSSLATSYVVKVSYSDQALSWSLSTSDGWPLHSSSSRLSFPLQNSLNHHCIVCSLAVPGPSALLMLRVVSAALQPILENHSNLFLV